MMCHRQSTPPRDARGASERPKVCVHLQASAAAAAAAAEAAAAAAAASRDASEAAWAAAFVAVVAFVKAAKASTVATSLRHAATAASAAAASAPAAAVTAAATAARRVAFWRCRLAATVMPLNGGRRRSVDGSGNGRGGVSGAALLPGRLHELAPPSSSSSLGLLS